MRLVGFALLLALLIFQVGCASYPRFPDESGATASQLLRNLGADARFEVIGPEVLRGSTLRNEFKMFVTDRNIHKWYFSSHGSIVYFQDWGLVAYGVLPIPTGHEASKGDVCPYSYVEGVFVIPASEDCVGPHKLVVTADRSNGEYVCWLLGERSPWPGWMKCDCTIEHGNTLKLDRR